MREDGVKMRCGGTRRMKGQSNRVELSEVNAIQCHANSLMVPSHAQHP